MAENIDPRYAGLSSADGQEPMIGAEAQPEAAAPQQLVLSGEDIKALVDLKGKGNMKAIGEYVASLI